MRLKMQCSAVTSKLESMQQYEFQILDLGHQCMATIFHLLQI